MKRRRPKPTYKQEAPKASAPGLLSKLVRIRFCRVGSDALQSNPTICERVPEDGSGRGSTPPHRTETKKSEPNQAEGRGFGHVNLGTGKTITIEVAAPTRIVGGGATGDRECRSRGPHVASLGNAN